MNEFMSAARATNEFKLRSCTEANFFGAFLAVADGCRVATTKTNFSLGYP